MLTATSAETGSILNYVRRSSLNLFSWMEWILKSNLPLSFCENEAAKRYSNLDSICVETLVSGMSSVTRAVERGIAEEIPDLFGLIFDGWSHASDHYIAVYARYEVDGVVKTPLLCMAPLLNEEEEDLSARGHMEFLATMLPRDYGKQLGQCCFLVGDNCSANRRLATLMGVPLIGCASHRLNRAVQADMQDYEDELDAVQKLMIKLRNLKQSAKLRTKTPLRPVIRQDTRWSSTFAMVMRYFTLLEFIDSNDDDIADLLPSPSYNRRLRALLADLKKVESVAKALQGSEVSLLDARVWLDGLISIKPHYARYIGPRAEIVHSPDFESGCVRVLGGNAARLTRAEKTVLTPFKSTGPPAVSEDEDDGESSFVQLLQKRRRLAAKETKYKLLHAIPATSNVVERFFSVARTTFGQERHGLQPITLEMILFLRENAGYWDAQTLDTATRA